MYKLVEPSNIGPVSPIQTGWALTHLGGPDISPPLFVGSDYTEYLPAVEAAPRYVGAEVTSAFTLVQALLDSAPEGIREIVPGYGLKRLDELTKKLIVEGDVDPAGTVCAIKVVVVEPWPVLNPQQPLAAGSTLYVSWSLQASC
jgi:hypothetical protein